MHVSCDGAVLFSLNPCAAGGLIIWPIQNDAKNLEKKSGTLAPWMVFKDICVIVLWMKIASTLVRVNPYAAAG